MVFVATFTAKAPINNIVPIITRIGNLSFVLECNRIEELTPIGDTANNPVNHLIHTPIQQTMIEGIMYGNYMGIKEVFSEILESIDGISNVVISIKESSTFQKYTTISALATASIVFTAIVLTQLDITYPELSKGNFAALLPILIGAGLAFLASYCIETLILIKERLRQ